MRKIVQYPIFELIYHYIIGLEGIVNAMEIYCLRNSGKRPMNGRDLTKHVVDVICKVRKIAEIELQPWMDWSITDESYNSPQWWVSYNHVKHNRIINYSQGNLGNVMNLLAGLYIIEMFYCKVLCNDNEALTVPTPVSELFEIENWERKNIIVGDNLILSVCE